MINRGDNDVFAWAVIATIYATVTLALWGTLLWEIVHG
jgi:hypothetical protein